MSKRGWVVTFSGMGLNLALGVYMPGAFLANNSPKPLIRVVLAGRRLLLPSPIRLPLGSSP